MNEITVKELWNALSAQEKNEACLAFWKSSSALVKEDQPKILKTIAEKLHFREVFIKKKSIENHSQYLRRLIETSDFNKHLAVVMSAWLLSYKEIMISRFLEVQGIKHIKGEIDDNSLPSAKADLCKALKVLLQEFPHKDVAVYMGILLLRPNNMWECLPEAIEEEKINILSLLGTQSGIKPSEASK